MMKTRVLSFLAAFLIITVAFTVAFMDPVSADDPQDWEPDNDEAIYLRPGDPGITKNYNYNYTDVALEEDVDFDCDYSTNEYSYDSEMSINAQVYSLKPGDTYNDIFIAISAPGAYRYNEEESDGNPNAITPWLGHVGTLGTAIEAEITGMEGYEDKTVRTPTLQKLIDYNSADNFTDGDAGCHDTGLTEWQELAIEGGLLTAETIIDAKTLGALSWAQYASKVVSTYAEDDPIDPFPEHKPGASGEEASVSQTWEHHRTDQGDREYHLFNLDYSEYEEHIEEGDDVDQELIDAFDEKGYEICNDWYGLQKEDDGEWSVKNENGGFFILEKHEDKLKIYGGDIPLERAHTASTEIGFRLPTDDLPDEATLEISAKNVLGTACVDGDIIQDADGAEASVEIPIRNAKPEVQSDMEMDKKNYETEDYPGYNKIYPVFHDLMVTNPTTCEEVPYEVKIDWRPGWDYGWETLTYDWISHGEWMEKEVSIPTPDDANGDTVDIRYTIKTYDQYGGWELDTEYKRDSFTVTNNDGDPPPGGPPRPPPGGPHPVSESSDDILDYSKQSYQVDDLWGYDWDTTSLEFIDTDQVESILEDEEVWLLEEDGVLYLVDERGDEVMFYIHS